VHAAVPSTFHRTVLARSSGRRARIAAAAVVVAMLSIAAGVRLRPASASPQVPLQSWETTSDRITIQSQRMYDGSVDGEIKLIVWKSGAYNVQATVHNGAKLKREFTIGCVVTSTFSGAKFAFATSDKIGGTSPFSTGGSKYRSPIGNGSMPGISDDWANLSVPTDDTYDAGWWGDCRITANQDKMALIKTITSTGKEVAGAVGMVVAFF
jgi:hypothetical protein